MPQNAADEPGPLRSPAARPVAGAAWVVAKAPAGPEHLRPTNNGMGRVIGWKALPHRTALTLAVGWQLGGRNVSDIIQSRTARA